jgi:hypothetical protein
MNIIDMESYIEIANNLISFYNDPINKLRIRKNTNQYKNYKLIY